MTFLVVRSDGSTQNSHECYGPALDEAKLLSGLRVLYEGIRGQSVVVWPLPTLDGP